VIVAKTSNKTPYVSLPQFDLLNKLPWLSEVSVWSAPPAIRLADIRDGFLLGGGGYVSARLGTRERVSTMERIMAPHLSSYNFAENNNFRMDVVRPSRDFYPPFEFSPTQQRIWRVRNTAIVITAERDDTYELVTVNAVHPTRHWILRSTSLKNISSQKIEDVGLSFQATPDIPFPIAGHRSIALPLNEEELLERVEEMKPEGRDYSPKYSKDVQRHRYMVRGLIGGASRGYDDLFIHWDGIESDQAVTAFHYLAPGLQDSEASAIESAQLLRHHLEATSGQELLQEVYDWWSERSNERTQIAGDNKQFVELLENNAVLQTSVERATSGFVVIDDYTGSWLRDHNGSHLFELDLGLHSNVRRSMDRYYGLDVSNRSLYSVYASDLEPVHALPSEPDWETVDGFVTGDVPNFRTLWYWWYFKHTGDLDLVRERFNYIKGAFMRQKLHERGYLAEFCFDETYGIGPVGPMRRGLSSDNSFIALAAARRLAYFAEILQRDDAPYLKDYALSIQNAIEKTFWLEKEGYYAMRVTPEAVLDKTPLSIGLMRPLWTGYETDHAISSALYVYKYLYRENGFLRLIPTHDQTVTMAIGYLLIAMKKMRHSEIDRVFNDVLKWTDPSGTFGEYLDEKPDGPWQCYEHMAHRNRMWESGINADAVLFALTGFDPLAYEHKARFAPHLPKGWTNFNASGFRVGDSRISIHQSRAREKTIVQIQHDSGGALDVELLLTSAKLQKDRDGATWTKNRFGIYEALIHRRLEPGERLEVTY